MRSPRKTRGRENKPADDERHKGEEGRKGKEKKEPSLTSHEKETILAATPWCELMTRMPCLSPTISRPFWMDDVVVVAAASDQVQVIRSSVVGRKGRPKDINRRRVKSMGTFSRHSKSC